MPLCFSLSLFFSSSLLFSLLSFSSFSSSDDGFCILFNYFTLNHGIYFEALLYCPPPRAVPCPRANPFQPQQSCSSLNRFHPPTRLRNLEPRQIQCLGGSIRCAPDWIQAFGLRCNLRQRERGGQWHQGWLGDDWAASIQRLDHIKIVE